jgi:hypothetical protein
VPDDEPALVDVHLVVGQHEADPLVLARRHARRGVRNLWLRSNPPLDYSGVLFTKEAK